MKYSDVLMLISGGVLAMTSHELSINSAYIVTKFKRELTKLLEEWQEKNNSLIKEAGIEDGEAFDKRKDELTKKVKEGKLNNSEAKELEKLNSQMDRLNGLRAKLADDDVTVNVKPMPFEDWHTFKNENKELKLNGFETLELADSVLENILWIAPE